MSKKETQAAGEELLRECRNCGGEKWVCENHQDISWNGGEQKCCGGAGAPCPVCNKEMACASYYYKGVEDGRHQPNDKLAALEAELATERKVSAHWRKTAYGAAGVTEQEVEELFKSISTGKRDV